MSQNRQKLGCCTTQVKIGKIKYLHRITFICSQNKVQLTEQCKGDTKVSDYAEK